MNINLSKKQRHKEQKRLWSIKKKLCLICNKYYMQGNKTRHFKSKNHINNFKNFKINNTTQIK